MKTQFITEELYELVEKGSSEFDDQDGHPPQKKCGIFLKNEFQGSNKVTTLNYNFLVLNLNSSGEGPESIKDFPLRVIYVKQTKFLSEIMKVKLAFEIRSLY